MTEKSSLSPQRIIDLLSAHWGIKAATLTLLPIGADMNASVYKAETQSGPSYFVKLKRGPYDDLGVVLLALLQASGIQEIVPPVKTVDGKLTQRGREFTLIVYPFVDGENGFCRHLTESQWMTLGRVLRRVHAFDVPVSLKSRMRKETYSPEWREVVRSLDAHMDERESDDPAALKLKRFMKEHRAIIQRLVERAEFLSKKAKKESPEFVLCHSDIHGGNVLIDGSGAIYIVDWDEPVMAPKERDLMFIGGGVANTWNEPREEEFFYQGYGKTEINKVLLTYYRHERIVVDIAEYGQALLLTKTKREGRLEMVEQFTGMFAPNGVVDIAFRGY